MLSLRHSLALLPLVFALACGPSTPDAPPNTLRIALEDAPRTLDPRFVSDAHGQRISRHLLYNSLVQHGFDLLYTPDLAESWSQPDPATYVFKLRTNVTFHDGTPLTAEDVVATFNFLMDPTNATPAGATLRQKVSSVEALDDHTVRVTQVRPSADFLTAMIQPIVPRRVIDEGLDLGEQSLGTGPFRLVSRSSQHVELAPHETYFGGAPAISLYFDVVKDAGTRFLKLRKGEIDLLINALPEHQIDDLEKPPLDATYTVVEGPGANYNYLAFNLTDNILTDVRVRRAVALALDLDTLIEHRLAGHATRSRGMVPPVSPHADPSLPLLPHDPDEARRLLDEAGFPDPDGDGPGTRFTLELKTSNHTTTVGNARVIQAQLAEVGIDVELRSFEWGTFYGDIQAGNFQLTLMRWVGITEPDFYFEIFHSGQVPPDGRNRGRFADPEMDRLLEEARFTLDDSERRRLYAEVQHMAVDRLPYVSLWHVNNVSVVHRRVQGYRQHPKGGLFSLRDITLTPWPPDDESP